MRPIVVVASLALLGSLVPAQARAQTPTTARPILHVGTEYRGSYFDLHPELTKDEFKDFAAQAGAILRARQLGDTTTLGKGRVELSLQYTRASIDDVQGAWNNTMSHPTASSYLDGSVAFPRVVARVGVSEGVDVGAWGGFDPRANYGMAGIETKVMLLRQDQGRPVSVSVRPSVSSLFGPAEVWAASASIDFSVSRSMGALSPYVGVSSTGSVAGERSNDVAFDQVVASTSIVYAGVAYHLRGVLVAAEIEKGALVSYGFRIGKRF